MSTTSGLRLSECTSATEKSTLRKEYVELIAKADVHMFEKLKKKVKVARRRWNEAKKRAARR